MMQGFLPRAILITVFAGFLTACGGGTDGGTIITPPDSPDDGGTVATPALALSLLDGANNAVTVVNGSDTARAQATLVDSSGDPVAGIVVTFNSSIGQITPTSNTALTNAQGIAEVTLSAGITAGAGNVSAEASVDGVTATSNDVGFQTDGLGSGEVSAVFTVTLVLTTPNSSQTVSRDNEGTATVTLTDANGGTTNTDGAIVSFSASTGDLVANAAFISGNTASVTLRAGATPGAGNLDATVTVQGETIDADTVPFITDGDSVATVVLSVPGSAVATANFRAATPVDGNVDNDNPVTVTATVIDRFGNPSEGSVVNFTLNGDGRLSRDSDLTNVSGQATTVLLAGTAQGFGQIGATATVSGQNVSNDIDNAVTFVTDGDEPFVGEGTSNLTIVIGLDTDGDISDEGEDAIDADNPGVLFATVTQANGSPSVNTVVRFSLGGAVGDMFPANGSALTDSAGVATVALTAGSVPGASSASAAIVIGSATFNSDSLTFSSLGNAGDEAITLTLTFIDATPGNGSNIITISDPAVVKILVEDGGGTNLPNRSAIVTTTLGSISIAGSTPSTTATAITDSDGQISVDLTAGNTFGSGTLSVTVGDTSDFVQFDVGVDGLQIGTCSTTPCTGAATFTPGALAISTSPLSAGGTSTVSLVVVDASQVVVPDISIAFTTNCAVADPPVASISTSVTSNSNGLVTATYLASGCVDSDNITATEGSAGLTATGTIIVLPATIGSIRFDSVSSPDIQIKGTGTSSANVIFQVIDVLGGFVEDATVSFELTTNVGGLSLVSPTGLTNAEGKATATVNAGLIPTTVRVRASVIVDGNNDGDILDPEDFPIETLSDGLSVNTGVPDQNSMSISASTLNIEGEDFDGITSNVTVRLADAFNNPVPDGTTVQFRTEFGSIESSCNTVAGNCTVTLQSQEPRRPTNPNDTVQDVGDSCPVALIIDETVTVSGNDVVTDYVPQDILRVEQITNTRLVEGVDFDVAANGITCTSANCSGQATLRISYNRMYLDEVGGGDGTNDPTDPAITNPGLATAPFVGRTNVPCLAAFRSTSDVASQYRSGLGQQYGGRSTILAFSQGEESFIDSNGNGQYDFGESFVDLTEAFHDLNEDDVFGNGDPSSDDSRNAANPDCYGPAAPLTTSTEDECYQIGGDEEEFVDFGDSDATNNLKDLDGKFNAGNGIYNGTLCPDEVSQRTEFCDNNATPCLEPTGRYCTRDLVNIRRDIVILYSDSSASFGVRDTGTGEYIGSVDVSGGGGLSAGLFRAGADVTANDGTNVSAGTNFSIGHGDSQVPPGVGETVSLTSGSGSVLVDISDNFSGQMSTGTSIAVSVGDEGCLISNAPGGTLTDSNGHGFTTIFISLAPNTAVPGGSSGVEVKATSVKGIPSAVSFNCST